MEKFFGRTYETVGNVSGDLLLKTRGGVKVQIGSSFIDLIKNGKINADIDIIKEASSKDNIIDNGLYIVKNVLYVKYQDTVLPLSSSTVENQVSYLPQLNITYEQQIQAQKNIGIYYDTLEEAQQNISDGYAYIKNQGIYIINNQNLDQVITLNYINSNKLNLFSVQLSNLYIGNTLLQETQISLENNFEVLLKSQKLLNIDNQAITIYPKLVSSNIQDINNIFQLYVNNTNGESYLKVDHIICSDNNQEYQANICNIQYYINNGNNIIKQIDISKTKIITLYLKYQIQYNPEDILHVEFDGDTYDFVIESYNSQKNTVIVTLQDTSLDPSNISQQTICYYKPKDTSLIGFTIQNNTITYGNDSSKTILGTLPKDLPLTNGFYSDCAVTKNQILISPNLDNPNLTNIVFKKSDNFPKLEEGWELPKEDNSQKLATTKWVNSTKYTLPVATSNILGGVIIGDGLSITNAGILSVTDSWTDILNTISNNVNTNTNDITTLKSQVANLQKAVQDLQNKLKS